MRQRKEEKGGRGWSGEMKMKEGGKEGGGRCDKGRVLEPVEVP